MYQFQADFEMKMEKMNYQLQKELEGQTLQPMEQEPPIADSLRVKLAESAERGWTSRRVSEPLGPGLAKKDETASGAESEAVSRSI